MHNKIHLIVTANEMDYKALSNLSTRMTGVDETFIHRLWYVKNLSIIRVDKKISKISVHKAMTNYLAGVWITNELDLTEVLVAI